MLIESKILLCKLSLWDTNLAQLFQFTQYASSFSPTLAGPLLLDLDETSYCRA